MHTVHVNYGPVHLSRCIFRGLFGHTYIRVATLYLKLENEPFYDKL